VLRGEEEAVLWSELRNEEGFFLHIGVLLEGKSCDPLQLVANRVQLLELRRSSCLLRTALVFLFLFSRCSFILLWASNSLQLRLKLKSFLLFHLIVVVCHKGFQLLVAHVE